MKYFVTGASGWIASGVIPELLESGHEVVGLARSDAAAEKVAALGATVVRGDLDDLDRLAAGATNSDGVVHLGYIHDFSDMAKSAATDRAAIETFGNALAGSGKPLLIASGTMGLAAGRVATESDLGDPNAFTRVASAHATLALADRGVRSIVVRFPPTVYGPGDHGFVAALAGFARENGVSGYVGDGSNRWPAVHRLDAGRLVRLVLESALAGTVVHAIGEEGVPAKQIAESLGRGLGLPVESVAPETLQWLGLFFAADVPASSAVTRERFGWEPTQPGLLEVLDSGAYTS